MPNVKPMHAVLALVVIFLLSTVSSFFSVVDEGHAGIKIRFGEAVDSLTPGLHLKTPFIDSVKQIEVRTRKYQLQMSAATTSTGADGQIELQMPSQVVVSANWNIPAEAALEIYSKYGGLEQYEDRILDPRVNRITKTVLSKYTIEHIVSNRQLVTDEIAHQLSDALSGLSATMTDVNLEDIQFPNDIANSIRNKQTAKLNAEAEAYNLEQKDLEAQRITKTANAQAEATKLTSIEKAAAIEREGLASAEAIKARAKALAVNPDVIELTKWENWDGKFPTDYTTFGGNGSTEILFNHK